MCQQHYHHNTEQVHTQHAVLDIGENTGALIIYTKPGLRGLEIEVSPKDKAATRVHTAVLEREVNGQTIFAALYMSLEAGEYTIWKTETEPAGEVTIVGGIVTELNWQ